MSTIIQQLNGELSAIVALAQRSLVTVGNGRRGAGAGIIVRSDGLILTNAHVVAGDSIEVVLPNRQTLPAQVLASDAEIDLALLSVQAQDLPAIALGDSQRLAAGELVLALGHPWGVTGAVSAGPVISVGRPLEMANRPNEYVQAGLVLRPGHSGGPMIDTQGRLIGVNAMITGPQVGLAVPVNVVKKFLEHALPQTEGFQTRGV
jgi:serine protease Do